MISIAGRATAVALTLAAACAPSIAAPTAPAAAFRARPPSAEVIYFLLPDRFENADPANDRGGLSGDRSATGFDPTSTAFYHGGDLKGVTARLGYLQDLGITAIWVGPVFRNKAVQGPPGHQSAGYHGYWIEDFTHVDPHLGTDADFKALVDAAHARGIKVYLDIVVNHTADVIRYRECPDFRCPYRSEADYPYQGKGGAGGPPINAGFTGEDSQSSANFAHLTRPDYAYTPYVPAGEEHAKAPDWLNDPIFYHNRGSMETIDQGEEMTHGDFGGLDDVFTENPRVVQGFIDIYGGWIDRYGIDGFRIDTARHVNPEFWQRFAPAMQARARARGIPNFTLFGEVYDDDPNSAELAVHTRVDKLPAVLDFSFRAAVLAAVAGNKGTRPLAEMFALDPLYEGGWQTAATLPTFISNHDAGRFAGFVRAANPGASDAEVLARVGLAHAMLLTLRGAPAIYSGDEQGFTGDGGDQGAREDMFPSKVERYNRLHLLGTTRTTAESSFHEDAPLYRLIATFAHLRTAHPALGEGRQIVRASEAVPGLFAVSRLDPQSGGEILVAFNSSSSPITRNVRVDTASRRFRALYGACPAAPRTPGSVQVTVPAWGTIVCAADTAR